MIRMQDCSSVVWQNYLYVKISRLEGGTEFRFGAHIGYICGYTTVCLCIHIYVCLSIVTPFVGHPIMKSSRFKLIYGEYIGV